MMHTYILYTFTKPSFEYRPRKRFGSADCDIIGYILNNVYIDIYVQVLYLRDEGDTHTKKI